MPQGLFSSPRLVSMMRQKGQTRQGCLTMGAEHRQDWSSQKAQRASSDRSHPSMDDLFCVRG
jgi:hypothetical protein